MIKIAPPNNEQELIERAYNIAGLTFAELAHSLHVAIPENLLHHKGWVGQLMELALGASAGSKPIPDFPNLGIELKTIPIDQNGKPLETTFVCFAPLVNLQGLTWAHCSLRKKLQRVLWMPIEGCRTIPLAQRHIGTPILWSPTPAQCLLLQQDWQELMDLIVLGEVEQITARHGQVLQLRPKAANGKALTTAYGQDGRFVETRPRGFYLKTQFTKTILDTYFER